MKRNLAEIEIAVGLARMIGDDRGRDHLKFAGPPAIQDIGQAVIGLRGQQHDPAAGGAVAHLPFHAEAFCNRRKTGLQRRQIDREIGGGETTRMKKCAVSTSLNCWASRMFWPLWARKVETAETMPGRSGQESVNTN